MTVPVKTAPEGDIMQAVLMKGDLAKLTPEERVHYYNATCKSLGLNPLTRPFEFITLNGQLRMYAARNCADQLRKINNVSLQIVSREVSDDILTVHVRAQLPDGRVDEDLGSVPFSAALKGEARANAELKCITKAKRRATLSICGLGWLDETEVASIPGARPAPTPAPNVLLHNPATTPTPEAADHVTVPQPTEPAALSQDGSGSGGGLSYQRQMQVGESMAQPHPMPPIATEGFEVAKKGLQQLERWWVGLSKSEQKQLVPYKDTLKDVARDADVAND